MNLFDTIEELKQFSARLDEHQGTSIIPLSAKRKFIEIWNNQTRNSILICGQIRISNQGSPTYAVTDELLLKCAKSVDLYREYNRLADLLSIHVPDASKHAKIGAEKEDSALNASEIESIKFELESIPELKPDIHILKMMLESKRARSAEGHVGPFKQITRTGDRWAPAHSKFIATLAADAYPNLITLSLLDHPEVADEIINDTIYNKDPEDVEKYLFVQTQKPLTISPSLSTLPKPFLLLAGISGTGKTRFVREQAKAAAVLHGMTKGENHCLVPVRPDWHEPSDLLGYISRIGNGGARYVTTDLLRFIVAAWKHAAHDASTNQINQKPLNTICPYWLCLDEMNLAPVEQYFADYLSILETRTWKDGSYSCEPLLKPAVINQQLNETGRKDLWENLGVSDDDPLSKGLQDYFLENGIPLPPNLIVAGTVNMDETTHGFSRKVIDRALTLDFGEFFPNDYQHYFENDKENAVKLLGFPHLSEINKKDDLAGVAADPEGGETILFLTAVNGVLAGTPFELAYRALNEALLAVVCFNPADESELQAVWDDFLMMKVLPRIEGDAEKLGSQDDKSLLTRLVVLLNEQFSKIIDGRRDLLNQSLADGSPLQTECRSLKKLAWMQKRLTDNGFTSFWP
jgi:hypothetical protein